MKHSILFSSALLTAFGAIAQTEVTVTTGPGNSTRTFYSLENGVQASAAMAEWDLAFEVNSFNSSILVNTAKGLVVYETPVGVAEWASLTTPDVESWTRLQNSEVDWSAGALTNGNNLAEPDGLNLGWGEYNMGTHTVAGTKVYVIDDAGTYRKLRINSLASSTYSFTYADLDGNNEQTASLVKTAFAGKNFGYFSFATNSTSDPEPTASTWDLLFTKYVAIIMAPEPTPYPVVGVLQNKAVLAMQVDEVPTADAMWSSAELSADINIIGSDWKNFNMSTSSWTFAEDRTYFVQDRALNIWKLIFINYGGSGTGEITFTQQLMSSVGVDEVATPELVAYPNPSRGMLNIVIGREVRNGQLSITDLAGKLVKQQNVNGNGALSAVPVDLAGVRPGMYIAKLSAEGMTFSTRVVVE